MKTIYTKTFYLISILLLSLMFFSACSDKDKSDPVGTVTGVITAANGVTPIPGATVGLASPLASPAGKLDNRTLSNALKSEFIIDPDGPIAVTNQNGEFTLEDVPVGEQMLGAKAGVFETFFTVNVEDGETTETGTNSVEPVRKLGYVSGSYDNIQNIITDLGFEVEKIDNSDLNNFELLSEYDMIFINCGAGAYSTERAEVLGNYVDAGGTIYASDLENRIVEDIFPGEIEFGSGGSQTILATIMNPLLEQFVQDSNLEITYNLGGWVRVTELSGAGNPESLLLGQPQEIEEGSEPLAFNFNRGNGRVVYTTFHNSASATEDQIQVLRFYIFLPSTAN